MTLQEILHKLEGVTGSGNQYTAKCPAHNDEHASLSISSGVDGRILLHCHAGCDATNIVAAIGLTMRDLYPPEEAPTAKQGKNIVTIYPYTDAEGKLLAQKIRYDNKSFSWRRPDGQGGWEYKRGNTKVLYNLPEVIAGDPIFIVEGEKDCETLRKIGLTATTAPDGAGGKSKWDNSFNEFFSGKTVIIIPDNDKPGHELAKAAADSIQGVAESVKLIDLSAAVPNLPEHADISDIAAWKSHNELEALLNSLIQNTPEYTGSASRTGQPEKYKGKKLLVKKLSLIEPRRAEYLLFPYLPKGRLCVIAGVSGSTKTWLTLYFASIISKAGTFITDNVFTKRTPGVVIYQPKENDYETDIRPRLDTLKANNENIFTIEERYEDGSSASPLSLTDKRIKEVLEEHHPQLLVFDPLQSYLGENVDMHKANEVRPILDSLADLAKEYQCTIVIVSHMSKMTTASALDRILGTSDLRNAARSIIIVGNDPNDQNRRVFTHAKNSLGELGQSVAYHIDTSAGGVVIDGFCDLEPDDVVKAKQDGSRNKPSVCRDEAINLLQEMLGEPGYCRLEDIQAAAAMQGISERTLQRAKKELFLKSLSVGYSNNKTTWWLYPGVDKETVKKECGEYDKINGEMA